MNILVLHNSYQKPGGEDQVFQAEADLLETYGHRVIRYQEHNDEVARRTALELLTDTIWNRWAYRQLRTLIREGKVDLMHVHNTFPLISPACYYAADAERVPVVQTLHNYRLLCPSATLFRNGQVCEDCLGKRRPWPAVLHSCYRGSRKASAVTATMLSIHNAAGTWQRKISAFVALTEFAREKFIAGGLPPAKIFVKPNFLQSDPGTGTGEGDFVLFVGRLTEEKGVRTLLEAWARDCGSLALEVIGDGPLGEEVRSAASENPKIRWRGWVPREEVFVRMKSAKAVVVASTWYESFPMTVVEAFASGTPVVASKLGSLGSLIEHERTGLHFRAGDAEELAAQVRWLELHPARVRCMREHARREFLLNYTGERNYTELMTIYGRVLNRGKQAPVSLKESAQSALR